MHGVDFMLVTEEEFNTFVEAESLIDQACSPNEDEMTGLCLDAVLEIIQAGKVAVFEVDIRSLQQIRSATLKPFVIFIKPPSLEVLMETRQMQPSRPQSDRNLKQTTSSEHSPMKSVPTTPQYTGINCSAHPIECTTPLRHTRGLRTSKNEGFAGLASKVTASLDQIQIVDQSSVMCKLNKSQMQQMIQIASRLEVTHGHLWDYVLINDDLPVALEQLSELAYRLETEAFWVPRHWVFSGGESVGAEMTLKIDSPTCVVKNSQKTNT
ncbi:hypothetical protein P879_10291 [Paragonimus westermani]|uniref:Guanylate kinase-like domain-containing protein n=1 Tax=Paragonimus westermani TaxID=34504 RepID=A0A8T0D8D2_9TREM|nr:hypothetical protein P879_10291 [Paragonimus westermani]